MSYSALMLGAGGTEGYWRLGETVGTTGSGSVADASGNSRPGTPVGGVTFGVTGGLTGDSDTAASFDGSNDAVTIPYNAALAPTGQVTVEFLVYRAGSMISGRGLVSKLESGGYGFQASAPTFIRWYVRRNSAYAQLDFVLPADQWNYVVGTYDGRYARAYLNGTLVGTNDAGGNYAIQYANNNALQIGADAGLDATPNSFFAGIFDEVVVRSTAISTERVSIHYQGVLGNFPAGDKSGLLLRRRRMAAAYA